MADVNELNWLAEVDHTKSCAVNFFLLPLPSLGTLKRLPSSQCVQSLVLFHAPHAPTPLSSPRSAREAPPPFLRSGTAPPTATRRACLSTTCVTFFRRPVLTLRPGSRYSAASWRYLSSSLSRLSTLSSLR